MCHFDEDDQGDQRAQRRDPAACGSFRRWTSQGISQREETSAHEDRDKPPVAVADKMLPSRGIITGFSSDLIVTDERGVPGDVSKRGCRERNGQIQLSTIRSVQNVSPPRTANMSWFSSMRMVLAMRYFLA